MSKVLYVVKRSGEISNSEYNKLGFIADRLVPDNLSRDQVFHTKHACGGLAYLVVNDMGVFPRVNNSLLCGSALLDDETWANPGGPVPSGDFSIFRNDDKSFEVVTNSVGSRALWYFLNDMFFIASTSQRAIIIFLGEFLFNKKVVPWVLSSGTLGPTYSWDKRIIRLPPSSCFFLNKKTWEANMESDNPVFRASSDKEELKEKLRGQIEKSVRSLGSATDGWVLPLSGGYDSRAILCYMSRQSEKFSSIKTITWGADSEKQRKGGDAYVAKKLAESLGVQHDFLTTDLTDEPAVKMLERYLLCSEGRIDHLAGYADGLTIWSRLHASGVKVVIRGDEGFGWVPVTSEESVRIRTGCGLCGDYENLKELQFNYGLEKQELPIDFKKGESETLEAWRDRLYHSFRIPTILSALSDIKYSYIEQVNPFIYDDIISIVREVPDEWRENKKIFCEIVNEISPEIEYAVVGSNLSLAEILSNAQVAEEIKSRILNNSCEEIFPKKLSEKIAKDMMANTERAKKTNNFIAMLKRKVPSRWRSRLRDTVAKPKVNPFIISFRAYIIIRMNEILTLDSKAFEKLEK